MLWVLWLVLAGVFGVAEAFTLTAALSVLGGAALLTAPVAALGGSLPVQLVVFAVVAGVGLAYQYLQTLPQLAQGSGNTVWVVPGELTAALQGLSQAFTPAARAADDLAAGER